MWHRAGTITVTKGSKTVTGAGGTAWVQNIRVGDGLQGPDGRLYEVTNVASDTALAIEPAYIGETASGMPYWIIPVLGYQKLLADRAAALVGAVGQLPGNVEANTQAISQLLLSMNQNTQAIGENALAIEGNEDRIANAEQAMLTKKGNLSELESASSARENLGLKSAATREAQSNKQDEGNGKLLIVEAFGLGSYGNNARPLREHQPCGFYMSNEAMPGPTPWGTSGYGSFIATGRYSGDFSNFYMEGPRAGVYAVRAGRTYATEMLTTANTTVDSSGFVKKASPIVQVFSKKIEKTDHKEIEHIGFKRISTGVYELTNAPLLSRDGWYIETPKDRNNNIYFTVDYEENIEENTLIIRTYEPDYRSGRAMNGTPVDILDGRFISLRFAETPSLYSAPDGLESKV